MTIDLDALESLAKAANRCEWGDAMEWSAASGDRTEGQFIAAASPSAILDLCAEVRRLRELQAANVEIKAAMQLGLNRYAFLHRRAELRAHEMGHYWYIKTVDVPTGMPIKEASLSNVIDAITAKANP